MQIEIAKSLSKKNLIKVQGFIGQRKDPGILQIDKQNRQVHFVNDRTNRW